MRTRHLSICLVIAWPSLLAHAAPGSRRTFEEEIDASPSRSTGRRSVEKLLGDRATRTTSTNDNLFGTSANEQQSFETEDRIRGIGLPKVSDRLKLGSVSFRTAFQSMRDAFLNAEKEEESTTDPISPVSTSRQPVTSTRPPIGSTSTPSTRRSPSAVPLAESPEPSSPNLLFIVSDQLRYDAVRYVQDRMSIYDEKLKVSTPNLDRLAASGAYFETAYSTVPICVPSRVSLFTGCTAERTGVGSNALYSEEVYERMDIFKNRIENVSTYEQLLVEHRGYQAENYGKWHIPLRFYFDSNGSSVITHNYFDYETGKPALQESILAHSVDKDEDIFKKTTQYLARRDNITIPLKDGWQMNPFSGYPYQPIQLDSRYGEPSGSSRQSGSRYTEVRGRDGLPAKYRRTAVVTDMATRAMERLAGSAAPFLLTCNIYEPHPPMTAASEYLDNYWDNRGSLLVQPSIYDIMANSPYYGAQQKDAGIGYDDAVKMSELTAVYYAMVEEVDHYVGRMLDKLEELGIENKTMVIFTADHGESLGAHGMIGKGGFLDEEVRVPLFISFPGRIPKQTLVREPIGHVDVMATIFDYFGAAALDSSDGKSLRRYIENANHNAGYDDRYAVAEWDSRVPKTSTKLSGSFGSGTPNFMIRYGSYKLLLTKKADSDIIDALYDLAADPWEMDNLLGANADTASDEIIEKTEHLKVLLIEWMLRHNGQQRFYADNKWNNDEGRGDITEIHNRRTWRTMDIWQSDRVLYFRQPVRRGSVFVLFKWLYIGRTAPNGTLQINSIALDGQHASSFQLEGPTEAAILPNEHVRLKVGYQSTSNETTGVGARIIINYDNNLERSVLLLG